MKTKKPLIKFFTILGLLIQINLTLFVTGGFSSEPIEEVSQLINYDLAHLQLTQKEIEDRDDRLNLRKFYKNATIGKLTKHLEKKYGIDVYHQKVKFSKINYSTSAKFIYNKLESSKQIMNNLTALLLGLPSRFYSAEDLKHLRRIIQIEDLTYPSFSLVGGKHYYFSSINTLLEDISEENELLLDSLITTISYIRKWKEENDLPFGLYKNNYYIKKKRQEGMYSTLKSEIFKATSISNFQKAMMLSNLKALDATIYFAAGSIITTSDHNKHLYHVVYPPYSDSAPIPKPVIFISRNADKYDIEEMLLIHAPKIYAYNKLGLRPF